MVEISKEICKFGNEQIEVSFRKAAPTDTPVPPPFRQIHYEGLKPGTITLSKGTVLMEGGCPLPCDIVWERDVPVPLHDGIIIYIDFFRPADGSDIPAILSWSPYGKSVPQGPPTGSRHPRCGYPCLIREAQTRSKGLRLHGPCRECSMRSFSSMRPKESCQPTRCLKSHPRAIRRTMAKDKQALQFGLTKTWN